MIDSIFLFTPIISLITIIIVQKVFISKKYFDQINKRSSHESLATRSGGISIFITFFIISFFFYIQESLIYDYSFIIPLGLLVSVGLYDDIYSVDFKLKFIFQIIAAKLIIDNGLIVDNLHGVFGIYEINRIIAQLITLLIIVSIINAINFIDGIDGLAVSLTAIFIISFEIFSTEITPFYYLSILTLLSFIPLYYFNFRANNKVFLGDSGSLFLGGIISILVIYILTNNYVIKSDFDIHKIVFVLSILTYPIIDLTRIIILRVSNGKSPFEADKKHLHHLLFKRVNSHKKVTIIICLISMFSIAFIQLINYLIRT